MANEVSLKIKIGDDGTLKIVAKDAKKAAKATDELGQSTDRVTKSRNRYHKAEKGVGQAGLSSAKSFSKMNQTIGSGSSGLVGAYAVLAANIFALTAAFGALQRAAQVEQLEQGLRSLGTASGIAMQNLAEGLQETTGHALALADAMRATALASSAGFDSSSIQRLGDVARKASIALGRDTADSLNRLTKGAIKLEPELLDELGIMVRLDEATENYARQLGKSANELTTFQKRQAFMNAVLEEGESKFAAMGDVDTNPFDKLSATFQDLTKTLINLLNVGILPVINFFANSQAALLGALILFGKSIATAMIPGKKAPILISKEMVETMRPGSVVIDLAVESGGNCPLSKLNEIVLHNDVKILGYPNMPGRVAKDASSLYSRNILNFLTLLVNKEEKSIKLDWNDEIIKSVILTHDGSLKLENFK